MTDTNKNGNQTCSAEDCLNSFTPTKLGDEVYCVTHDPWSQ